MAVSRSIEKDILTELIKKGRYTPSLLAMLKRRAAKKTKKFARNADLLKFYHKALKNKTLKKNEKLETLLRRREVRTLSGVAVITVLTKPFPCPGQCLYCPSEKGMPKSYLKNEPAAARAFLTKFDPYTQVKVRLKALADNGHPTDKIELIVLGGTWSSYPKRYQYWFIKECFRACNEKGCKPQGKISELKKYLKAEQKKNETAKHRIIGLTLETRPDKISLKEIKTMRDLGCTRVELGAQTVFEDILKLNRRGHGISETINATRLLKDNGFKVNYHIMLNLPGSNLKKDKEIFKILFSNSNFQPDLLKIYPCVVLKTAALYKIWQEKKYNPYSEKELANLLLEIKKTIPPYVRIQRIIRDIPAESIMAGSKISNLRQLIENSGKKHCQCIRCREVKGNYSQKEPKLFRREYEASDGKEIFLSFEDSKQEKLFALLRLRLPGQNKNVLPEIKDSALIRELHTYGHLVPIGQKNKKAQHSGLGKKLLAEAEKIVSNETNYKKISIISGVGVREYYKKLGYKLSGKYMLKSLS